MIRQFSALCRIKELREEKLQLAVQAKRREIREAESTHKLAVERAQENARFFPERERAIYAQLIGRVEKLESFELAKSRVKRLEAEQQALVDAARKAEQEVKRRQKELADLKNLHRRAQIERDKYHTTMQELKSEAKLLSEAKEESEQEETATARFKVLA